MNCDYNIKRCEPYKFNMKQINDVNQRIQGYDFEETETNFIIYSVPIAAEMVQSYGNLRALKDATEIKKIAVDRVPLTMVDDSPSHPDFLEGKSANYTASVSIGFMVEPTKLKPTADIEHKRYADFVIHKDSKTQVLINDYKDGKYIDTSMGFKCDDDFTPGKFNGQTYDYIQRNIALDHNAILMSADGQKARGRMPSPIGGIGADSSNNETGDILMDEETKKIVDTLKADNATLTKSHDEANANIKKVEDAKLNEDAKEVKDMKTRMDTLTLEKDEATKKLEDAEKALKVYKDAEEEVLSEKRKALIEKDAAHADLYKDAAPSLIEKFFDKMNKDSKPESRDIGADMMSKSKSTLKKDDRMKTWFNGKKEDGDK